MLPSQAGSPFVSNIKIAEKGVCHSAAINLSLLNSFIQIRSLVSSFIVPMFGKVVTFRAVFLGYGKFHHTVPIHNREILMFPFLQ